jgi:hypothetical protein
MGKALVFLNKSIPFLILQVACTLPISSLYTITSQAATIQISATTPPTNVQLITQELLLLQSVSLENYGEAVEAISKVNFRYRWPLDEEEE